MDAKEAIKILNSHPIWCSEYPYQKCAEATDLGIEALEKQVPKEHKPERWNIDRWSIKCPSCGAEIDSDSDFCKWCGQAIKNDKE